VVWLRHFGLDTPIRFDGSSNPVRFLQLYAIAIRATRGDGRVMANWFLMATKGEAREWLLGLPPGAITSWKDLCERQVCSSRAAPKTSQEPWVYQRPRLRRRATSTQGWGLRYPTRRLQRKGYLLMREKCDNLILSCSYHC
jgi:hypothetical protein